MLSGPLRLVVGSDDGKLYWRMFCRILLCGRHGQRHSDTLSVGPVQCECVGVVLELPLPGGLCLLQWVKHRHVCELCGGSVRIRCGVSVYRLQLTGRVWVSRCVAEQHGRTVRCGSIWSRAGVTVSAVSSGDVWQYDWPTIAVVQWSLCRGLCVPCRID